MLLPLDGPAKPAVLSVGTATPVEVKAGGSAFEERKVITLQSLEGKFYVYFADQGETPNAATVASTGVVQVKNAKESYEATGAQAVFVLSTSGTIDIRIFERA